MLVRSALVALLSGAAVWADDGHQMSPADIKIEQEYMKLVRDRRAGITAGLVVGGFPVYASIKVEEPLCGGTQAYDYFMYSGLSDGVNWNDARSFCENAFDGTLATVECDEERQYIKNLGHLYGGPDQVVWLGGQRKTGGKGKRTYKDFAPDISWQWIDGTPFTSNIGVNTASAWRTQEPSYRGEKCLLQLHDGQWNDARCGKVAGVMAMCKRKHVDTTTTTKTVTTTTTTTASTTTTTAVGCEVNGWTSRTVDDQTCCYKYFNRVVNKKSVPDFMRETWAGAKAQCRLHTNYNHLGDRVHLATIDSEKENTFVRKLIYVKNKEFLNRPVWLGAKRASAGADWKWVDRANEGLNWTNWRAGEPSATVNLRDTTAFEGCLQMTQPRQQGVVQDNMMLDNGEVSGDWNDAKCTKKRGYVCEFCHDSSILDP